jgi:predicted 3-demethylubiquinone-9 3-methyltransferase (glyoxalase superfamily)
MQKMTTFLWFDGNAEAAMNFYLSVFKNSKVLNVTRYGKAGPGPEGTVMVAHFEINGQMFAGLNGGPHYKFTPAISFAVQCETQAEIDELWSKLSDGGKPNQCGWVDDKFGVSWQVVPAALGRLLSDPDPAKTERVMRAMLAMKKFEIQKLQDAFEGRA